jgi:dinuclear metal center YbgI/SA1388 family protein
MGRINTDDFIGRRVYTIIRNDISYYAMHTNFDVMGMADAAADELSLKDREVLGVTYEDDISKEGFGRVGSLKSCMTLEELAKLVKEKFNVPNVRVFGDLGDIVKVAAIIPGSGESYIDNAVNAKADVIITGDIGHHGGIDAVAKGIGVIDAGHYGIEKLFIPYMEEFIKRELPDIKIFKSAIKEPFVVV